jgi:Zn2+/Cd2+-exporting ATPase
VEPADGVSTLDVLTTAAALERQANHPIAAAIVRQAQEAGLTIPTADQVEHVPGGGVSGRVHGRAVLVGSRRWLAERGVDGLTRGADAPLAVGVAVEGRVIGWVEVADRPRPDARRATQRLRELTGVDVWMLSGDAEAPTRSLADAVGVEQWRAGLLPADKVAAVEALQARHGPVLMVGDGVNDGPALATASVGVAMGGGTDVAFEAADAALMRPDMSLVAYAIALGRQTVSTVRANVILALALKVLVVVLAAFGMASLWLAVAADVGASLLVVAIGLRLLRFSTTDIDGS